jgi:hypothetical protein
MVYKKFKEYYADPEFKKKFKEKHLILFECSCGCVLKKSNKFNHENTEKHKRLLREKTSPPVSPKLVNASEEAIEKMILKILARNADKIPESLINNIKQSLKT